LQKYKSKEKITVTQFIIYELAYQAKHSHYTKARFSQVNMNLTHSLVGGFTCKSLIFMPLCKSITCQLNVLESCSNTQKTWQV